MFGSYIVPFNDAPSGASMTIIWPTYTDKRGLAYARIPSEERTETRGGRSGSWKNGGRRKRGNVGGEGWAGWGREREKEKARSRKRRRITWIIRTCEYSRGITRGKRERGRKRDRRLGPHFHGVAVTEIKMVAGAGYYNHHTHGGLTTNVSAPYMAAACAPRRASAHICTYVHTYVHVRGYSAHITCVHVRQHRAQHR